MLVDGERLKALLQDAENRVLLCSPFIKARVLETLFSVTQASVQIRIVTRWRPVEVAAGVSDLEVFEIARERPNTELALLHDLHAKLYLADDRCLIGSANLTATALGWSQRSNIELLTPASPADPDIARLLHRLEAAEPATFSIRSEIAEAAAALGGPTLDEGEDIAGEDQTHLRPWLPRCAAPDRLFEVYQNPKTTAVVEGTKADAAADLRDMSIAKGLSPEDFRTAVKETLRLMPAFLRIIEHVPQGITDAGGIALVESALPELEQQDARVQWRILRDWIEVFFSDEFEVAPESFVTRLRQKP